MIESLDKGIAFHTSGQLDKAKKIYESIIQSDASNFEAMHLLGVIFFQKKNYHKSIGLIRNSININPKNFGAYNNLGNVFKDLRKYSEAITNYNKAIEINPNYSGCLYNLAKTYTIISNYELALNFYKRSISSDANFFDAYYDYAELLEILGKFDEALENYYKLLKLKNNYPYLKGSIVHLKLKTCQWQNLQEEIKDIENNIIKEQVVNPFQVLVITDSSKLQKIAIEKYSQHKFPEINIPLSSQEKTSSLKNFNNKKKIKIGYYCSDFSNHPTGRLTAGLFENHNKDIFEIYGFYFGNKNDSSTLRISDACTKFINVLTKSDLEIANLSRNLGIDIAIDFNGFIKNCRPNIFAYRSAKLQINYLAFPATMGSKYMDYIIADRVLIPENDQKFFTEKIIYLPNCYQVSDQKRLVSKKKFSKKDFNLPEESFIFCCFNNVIKISPEIFEVWMKILKNNIKSVLWLLSSNNKVINNLKAEAEKRGVNKKRLIFCERLPNEDHLARYKLADLFLDTIPYNAHTTANEALYCGIPVLTLIGNSFASRVGASILSALNMKELIAHSKIEYHDIASDICQDSSKIKSIKDKLSNNKETSTLFDTKLYVKNLELAYLEIYKKNKKNLKSENIYIIN
jgi:predicted O-linked N-acetylglucosamine transferase (SPINDLY family)